MTSTVMDVDEDLIELLNPFCAKCLHEPKAATP